MSSRQAGKRPLLEAAATVATILVLGVLPVVWTGFYLVAATAHESLAYDFREAYLPAAHAVLDGESPYPALDDPDLAAETAYVYPPLLAYALVPFTALPENAASVAATFGALALFLGTLLVLGIRDWRVFGAALLWTPTLNALHTASSSLLLAFGAALAWRYRERLWPLALALGLAIAVKLVVWPLLVWTFATRRLRATAAASAIAAGVTLTAWALLGFEDLGRYPSLLRRLAELEAEESYSLVAFGATLGLGGDLARVLAAAVGVALLAVCAVAGRRGDELRSFALALAAALALTPILWQHYLVLLLVPLAVARPGFSPIWLLPAILWLAPTEDNGAALQTLLPALVGAALVVAVLGRADRPDVSRAHAAAARP